MLIAVSCLSPVMTQTCSQRLFRRSAWDFIPLSGHWLLCHIGHVLTPQLLGGCFGRSHAFAGRTARVVLQYQMPCADVSCRPSYDRVHSKLKSLKLISQQEAHLHPCLDERADGIRNSCLHSQTFLVRCLTMESCCTMEILLCRLFQNLLLPLHFLKLMVNLSAQGKLHNSWT